MPAKAHVLLAALAASVAAMAACMGLEAAGLGAAWRYGLVASAVAAGTCVVLLWRAEALWRRHVPSAGHVLSVRHVLVGAVLFRLLFVALPPLLSDDAYRYVWDGLVQREGVSPYRYRPSDAALAPLQDEPVYDALNSKDYYSVYPSASQLVFALAVTLGYEAFGYEGGWRGSYYLIKLCFVLAEGGGLWLLSRITSARALMLYAWHPLVLVEVAAQPHTEALLVLFLMLAAWAVRRRRAALASVALAAAAHVKLYPLVLMPFLWRRFGWRGVWPGALALFGLAAPYADAFVLAHMRESLDLYVRLFEFNAGPYYLAKEALHVLTGADWSKTLGPLLRAAFVGVLPVLYVLDARRRWPISRAFLVTLGAFFLCATTVHPWYLLAVLPLAALRPPAWHWQWLGLSSLGTYLFYVGGPYWPFVWIGWGGWLLLALFSHRDRWLQLLLRRRARRKAQRLASHVPHVPHVPEGRPLRVLDLGAGEGYVGAALAEHVEAPVEVTLADVVDLNRTALPHVLYDGRRLPFADDAFDAAVLYFVLHHAERPEHVLREALRVAGGHVLIVESVYTGRWQHCLLRAADRLANRLRGGRAMRAQEAHVRFRTAGAWRNAIERAGGHVASEKHFGSRLHPQVLFVVENIAKEN